MVDSTVPHKVFLVDDMPAVRQALRWAFEDTDDLVVVGEAVDGREAIASVSSLKPDIVILDIELPGLDGYAVARALKASAHPPLVIFLTVHSDPLSRQRSIEAGGDGFVEKGSGWSALVEQVRRSLAGR